MCPRAECQAYKLSLDVDVDWFNILFTKCENTVETHFNDDHFYILPVRAPQLYYFCVVDYHANVNSNWSRRSTKASEIKLD